ncbi:response regulator [Stenotrophomonas tumulicola]|uniref:Response regulator transcription factor n=1 Tax=Stenotrophomonas tumulicola TaxID=1685415 RepID=A0A7W3FPV4_9GAMM|nr:response regulator transcription factor [Stenotrophomonas tumulicola]
MFIRTIIADDHPIILHGARVLLRNARIDVVGEAPGGESLLTLLARQSCDVVLTDLTMPGEGLDGLELLDRIQSVHPGLPLVVLTGTASPSVLATLMQRGVRGALDKAADFDELAQAVRTAASGQNYVSQNLRSHLEARDLSHRARPATLSQGEREVLEGLRNGLSINTIAQQRGRSPKTVSRQKSDAMRKLGLTRNHELHAFLQTCPISGSSND